MLEVSRCSVARLDQFKTQHELARNFYDDYEFCPLWYSEEVTEHRQRIQQRISPQSSPSTSPSGPPNTRAIPIIDPTNMTPVHVPCKPTSPPLLSFSRYPTLPTSASYHRIIPIVNPATGKPLYHPTLHNVSVQ